MLKAIKTLKRRLARKRGAILMLVLVILALGSIVVTPLLVYISSGLNTTRTVYENNTNEVYAADAGIADAQYKIKYGDVSNLNNPVAYADYDYSTSWGYDLANQVNAKGVHVSVENVWIPTSLPETPTPAKANTIVQANHLAVTESAAALTQQNNVYTIKITYDSAQALHVDSIGVWLPPGYTYAGSSSFENPLNLQNYPPACISGPSVSNWAGNQAIVWSFPSHPAFTDFPSPYILTGTNPRVMTITFRYNQVAAGPPFTAPMGMAWINTTDGGVDFPYAWDADVKVFHITSVSTSPSGSTKQVESYIAQSALRHLSSAIGGDYYATGNSNLSASGNNHYNDQVHDPSSAAVTPANSGIPPTASVAKAFLYWSGWKNNNAITTPFATDTGSNISTNWVPGVDWSNDASDGNPAPSYKGASAGGDGNLTLKNSLDLSAGGAIVSWDQQVHSGNATQLSSPVNDGDSSGTWTSTPAGGTSYSKVNETFTTTAWLSPSNNGSAVGGGFTNPTNAYADGTNAATANNGNGHGLSYYNYNLPTLPAGSTISGIEVRLDWWLDSTSNTNSMGAELSWNAGTNWTASGHSDTSEPTADPNGSNPASILGGSSDTWGRTWALNDLTNANFRVRVTCSSSGNRNFSLDWIPVRITYSTSNPDSTYITYAAASSGSTPWLSPPGPVTTSWLSPTATNVGDFTNPTRAYSNDTNYAVGTGNSKVQSYWTYSNPAPAIPAGSTITGIEVALDYWISSTSVSTNGLGVELSWNGGTSWTNSGHRETSQPTADPGNPGNLILGGPADLWGQPSWTLAQVSSANFRVRVTTISSSGSRTFNLDWVPVRFTYATISDSVDTGGNGAGFTNPINAYAAGGGVATTTSNGNRHRFFNFDTSGVPAGSTVAGIEVQLNWWVDSTSNSNSSLGAELSWDGGTSWTAVKTDTNDSTSTSHTVVLGATNDNWNHTWTTAQLSTSNFRVRLTYATDRSRVLNLDWVQVRITYSNTGYKLFSALVPPPANPLTAPFAIPLGSGITDLTVYVRAREASSSNGNDIRPSIKVDDILYNTTASSNDPGTTFTTYSFQYTTNPATPGVAWTAADLNGTGAHPLQEFGAYTSGSGVNIDVSQVYAEVHYDLPVSPTDGLDFSFSTDGGGTWSDPFQAFRGDIGSTPVDFSFNIPSDYTKANFKMRFSLVGFASSGQKVNIDNIQITAMPPDPSVTFAIDDGTNGARQVSFAADGITPQLGGQLRATKSQELPVILQDGTHFGYTYDSFCDVTALVQKYSQKVINGTDPAVYPGYATYSVGGIDVNSLDEHGSHSEAAYAIWSIIIVYTSPDTLGHQIYLYDKFIFSGQDTANGVNVDFDGDGTPGGTISGFVMPKQVTQAVTTLNLISGGSGYLTPPAVVFTGGGGNDAAAMAQVDPVTQKVTKITITNGGSGYTSAPTISFKGGGVGGADVVANPAIVTCTVGTELNAAKLTAFVGEGDVWYDQDYIAMNGVKLWDGTNTTSNSKGSPNNVFNSQSIGLSMNNGIDIDTLGIDPTANPAQYITWGSNILKAGDTSAHIDMVTHTDGWWMIYMILSFRSVTTTGGPLGYIIK